MSNNQTHYATLPVNRAHFDEWLVPTYAPAEFVLVKGEGSKLWDQSGKEYIDFAGGIAVNALGHAHPKMLEALTEQAKKVWHLANGFTNEPVLRLAKQLIDSTFAEKVFFCNSGAEANEAALKLARKYALDKFGADSHKTEIVAFNNAFHGRTLFTVTAGGQPKYSADFAPLPDGIHHTAFNDITAAEALISDKTCAVIVEPMQGEGGVMPADLAFLQKLRELCDKHNALLIFDEVQTGVGRTGKLYAYMHYGVVPDILSTAKALGGGFPIGAMLTKNTIAASFGVGTHGTTYGGNPLASAVASQALSLINTAEVLDGVLERHEHFKTHLNKINAQFNIFKEIRGMGLLIGAEMNEAFQNKAKDIVSLAGKEGVLALIAGPNVVRFAPSLIIPKADIDEGMLRLTKAIQAFIG